MIEAAVHEERAGDWTSFARRLAACGARLPRNASKPFLEERRGELVRVRAEVETAYLASLNEQEMSANDSDSDRHIQNSNTEPHFENNSGKKQQRDAAAPRDKAEGDEGSEGWPPDKDEFGPAPGSTRAPETKGMSISLERLKAACPQFENYAKAGISSWRDAVVTAGLVRSMLGMSPDAWERARQALGEAGATVAVAAILERAGGIRSPGGYLRALTMRAEDGKFSVLPMIQALENR